MSIKENMTKDETITCPFCGAKGIKNDEESYNEHKAQCLNHPWAQKEE